MMKEALLQIFGTYEPVVVTLPDGSAVACVDFAYLAGVAIFGICLFSLFKLIGVLLKR